MFQNIPEEIRKCPQWVNYRLVPRGDKFSKPPFHPNLDRPVDKTNFLYFSEFDDCVAAVESGKHHGIGFCLTPSDPYCVIDLDPADTPENAARHKLISEAFDTYQEVSPSGQGLHIVCKGSVPTSRNSKALNLEIYSEDAFMTFTGNVFKDSPINESQAYLDYVYALFTEKSIPAISDIEGRPQTISDEEVLRRARSAANAEKFNKLWNEQLPAGKRSNGDIGLMNLIVFYSRNREQSKRIWLQSPRAQVSKSGDVVAGKREDYFYSEKYGLLTKAFDKVVAEEKRSEQLQAFLKEGAANFGVEDLGESQEQPHPISTSTAKVIGESNIPNDWSTSSVSRPPGLMGLIADYSMAGAEYPLPEAAVAAAIGLLSGVAGRSYNFRKQALNHYILLIAGSGTGKDRAQSVITELITILSRFNRDFASFKGPNTFTTDTALRKAFKSRKFGSMISIFSEFSALLEKMNNKRDKFGATIRSTLLELFTLGSHGMVWGEAAYADTANNVGAIDSPAFSFLGDIQPTLFENCVDGMDVESGFVSRLLCLHGQGLPISQTNAASVFPSTELLEGLKLLASMVQTISNQTHPYEIAMEPALLEQHHAMRKKLDQRRRDFFINGVEQPISVVRARLPGKAIKLAALAAVSVNPVQPYIDQQCYEWAYNVAQTDLNMIVSKIESGNVVVGNRQFQQETVVKRILQRWLLGDHTKQGKEICKRYPLLGTELNYIIPRTVIAEQSRNSKCFKMEADFNRSLFSILRALQSNGVIIPADDSLLQRAGVNFGGNYYCINPEAI